MRPVHSPTLRDVAAVFFRHKRLLITCFTVFAVTGILYSTLFPSYESQMKVLIRRGRIDPVITPTPSPSPAFEHDEITEEELNSEVELLTDEDILRQVVLATDLAKPTWKSRLLGETSEQRTQKAVQRLAKQLDIKPIRKSRLIAISYRSSDSARSAAVLQALSRTYLTKHAELHRPRGQQTFFEQQMQQARQELEHAQANLIAFTHNAGVESAGLQRDLTLQKLSEAEANELALISDMAEATERVQSLRTQIRTLTEQRVVQVKHADNPESLGKMKTALLQLQLRRTELLTKFQPSYRLVQEVDEQIAQAKASIEAEELTPLRDETTEQNPEYTWAHSDLLKTEVQLAGLQQKAAMQRRQVEEYRAEAESLGEKAVVQHDLEQNLNSAEEKWLLYSGKREESRIGDALDENGMWNVAIAQEPRAPAVPVWPFWSASCLTLLGAFGLSTGIVFVKDYLDPCFRTPDEVFAALGTPVLASIPAGGTGMTTLEA